MLYALYLRKPGKTKTDTETMGEQRTQDETNILKTVKAFSRRGDGGNAFVSSYNLLI